MTTDISQRARKREERKRRMSGIEPDSKRHNAMRGRMVPVRCVETGDEFDSYASAAFSVGKHDSSIRWAVQSGRPCCGYHWEVV